MRALCWTVYGSAAARLQFSGLCLLGIGKRIAVLWLGYSRRRPRESNLAMPLPKLVNFFSLLADFGRYFSKYFFHDVTRVAWTQTYGVAPSIGRSD